MEELKKCHRCHVYKPLANFRKSPVNVGKKEHNCSTCMNELQRERRHKNGINKAMNENKICSSYLGNHITEQLLGRVFEDVQMMPYGNPGYDFICKKGYKIDAKSSCLIKTEGYTAWKFTIKRNTVPDYFCLVGFDNREELNVLRWWLIPRPVIEDHFGISIYNTEKALQKWKQYERPVGRIVACCNSKK